MIAFPGIFLGLVVLPYEERTVPEGRGEYVTGTLAGAASVGVFVCVCVSVGEREREWVCVRIWKCNDCMLFTKSAV